MTSADLLRGVTAHELREAAESLLNFDNRIVLEGTCKLAAAALELIAELKENADGKVVWEHRCADGVGGCVAISAAFLSAAGGSP